MHDHGPQPSDLLFCRVAAQGEAQGIGTDSSQSTQQAHAAANHELGVNAGTKLPNYGGIKLSSST